MKISDFITSDLKYNWDLIETIPEFIALKGCQQNPRWHKEGNAWNHTKLVCEAAQELVTSDIKARPKHMNIILLVAALFHDIGKGVTTKLGKDGNWHAYGHEIEGERLTRLILWDEDWYAREQVCALVRWHMEPSFVFDKKDYLERIIEINDETYFEYLVDLKMCDLKGCIQDDEKFKEVEIEKLNCLKKITKNSIIKTIPTLEKMSWKLKERWGDKKPIDVYLMIGIDENEKAEAVNRIIDSEGYHEYLVLDKKTLAEKIGKHLNDDNSVSENFEAIFINDLNLKRKQREMYKSLLGWDKVKWIYTYVDGNHEEDKYETDLILGFDWPRNTEYDIMRIEVIGHGL